LAAALETKIDRLDFLALKIYYFIFKNNFIKFYSTTKRKNFFLKKNLIAIAPLPELQFNFLSEKKLNFKGMSSLENFHLFLLLLLVFSYLIGT
jgi:hypothetical protein